MLDFGLRGGGPLAPVDLHRALGRADLVADEAVDATQRDRLDLFVVQGDDEDGLCLLYTSPSPRD